MALGDELVDDELVDVVKLRLLDDSAQNGAVGESP